MAHVEYVIPQLHVRDNSKHKGKRYPRQAGKCAIPDADVLAMRRLHQVERKTAMQVTRAFPQYSPDYVKAILQYTARPQKHLWVNGGVL
jgi:hypothetical protein